MFKIESYVTPILLSYVDKYVRDFKPADAQVSLWGGGVALHNLVLKADVLQQEVALPFTLVSGRIHELLIQVPWTKIMSEPIVVTIDTIECVLNLNRPEPTDEEAPQPTSNRNTQVVEAPPGYMQALVRRIVSNIALKVHHLIVKYVEDDIVMSLNIKHLSVESAGVNWEPSFADIDQNQPVVRRLVKIDDLTLCLDKADADGKIRFYQEPLLYRCQLDFRVLTRLVSAATRRASSLSVEARGAKLAWSVTSEQLALLVRLVRERTTQQPAPAPAATVPSDTQTAGAKNHQAEPARSGSWSEWAWSWMPAWSDKPGGSDDTPAPPAALPLLFSAYLDEVSLVFKVMEVEGARKRSRSVLEVMASFACIKSSVCVPTAIHVRCGARDIALRSHGRCVCGLINYEASTNQPSVYLQRIEAIGEEPWHWPEELLSSGQQFVLKRREDSKPQVQIQVQKGDPPSEHSSAHSEVTDTHAAELGPKTSSSKTEQHQPEDLWVKMAPVLFVEFMHERSPPNPTINPYDNPPKDFQYSDWVEVCRTKIKMAPLELRVCMGLIHRLRALAVITKDLISTPQEQPRRVLTVEECDALSENLPERRIVLEATGFRVMCRPWNHTVTERPVPGMIALDVSLPRVSVTCNGPLYSHRVCSAVSQMPGDYGPLWHAARLNIGATMLGVQVSIATVDKQTQRPCARTDVRFVMHTLLHKSFFAEREPVEYSYSIKITDMSLCGSSARLQAAYQVPLSLVTESPSALLRHSSLIKDALNDEAAVAIDLSMEELVLRGYLTRNINTHVVTLQSAKAYAFHEPKPGEVTQAWLFSAPDQPAQNSYLRLAVQWCNEIVPNSFDYIGVWAEPTAVSVDPLLIAWLAYQPVLKYNDVFASNSSSGLSSSSRSLSTQYIRRRTPPQARGLRTDSGTELVHLRPRTSLESNSDISEKRPFKSAQKSPDLWWQGEGLVKLHKRLRSMLINMEIGLIQVYVTMSSASALDCETLHDTMEKHAVGQHRVFALSLGRITISSNVANKGLWNELRHDGPTFITQKIEAESFPWKIRLADVSCYTLEANVERSAESGASLRSTLKSQIGSARPRTVLELVTTTITVSVVIKTLQFKKIELPQPPKKQTQESDSPEKEKTKYFTRGAEFKPTTLQEFFRGPTRQKAKRDKTSDRSQTPPPTPEQEKEKVTITDGPIVSLGVHLHADTPPLVVRIEKDQIHIMSAALHCLNHIVTLLKRESTSERVSKTWIVSQTNLQQSRSQIQSVSEVEEIHTQTEEDTRSKSSDIIQIFDRSASAAPATKVSTFFWFQWVISRMTLVVASNIVKLAFDVEDVLSTVDLQSQYNQLKVKVARAHVRHYERVGSKEWQAGVLGGRVLEARETGTTKDDDHFLGVTITQAQISNLPASWKQEIHPKLLEQRDGYDIMWEVYATLAPLEAIIQPVILDNIVTLFKEMAPRSYCSLKQDENRDPSWHWPSCYVTAGGLRVLLSGDDSADKSELEDTFVINIGRVSINPHPDNPICRRSVGPSVSETSWLGAASNYEGRQYEATIQNIDVRSARFAEIVHLESAQLNTQPNENPAVKWSKQTLEPSLTPILYSMDLCCVFAPALYVNNTLVCGPGIEVNIVTDCSIEVNLEQIVLWQRLHQEMLAGIENSELGAFSRVGAEAEKHDVCPYKLYIKLAEPEQEDSFTDITLVQDQSDRAGSRSFAEDSGVETLASQSTSRAEMPMAVKKSVSIMLGEQPADVSEYMEVFVTMGAVELSLYAADDDSSTVRLLRSPKDPDANVSKHCGLEMTKEVTVQYTTGPRSNASPSGSDVASGRSITETTRDADIAQSKMEIAHYTVRARKIEGNLPLLHTKLYQPNFYYWRRKGQKSIQFSLFDLWLGIGAGPYHGAWHLPLLSTGKGAPDPTTDIPPALLTVKAVSPVQSSPYASSTAARGTVRADVERPVRIEVCTDRLRRLLNINTLIRDTLLGDESFLHRRRSSNKLFVRKVHDSIVSGRIESVTLHVGQVGICGEEGTLGFDSATVQVAAGGRPERVVARGLITALLLTTGPPTDRRHVVLQPLIMGVEATATWESWIRTEGGPLARKPVVAVSLELDRVVLDVRPADLQIYHRLHQDVLAIFNCDEEEIVECFHSQKTSEVKRSALKSQLSQFATEPEFADQDQFNHYYKDDLRSGAFKILEGPQMPMAYQVILHKNTVSWRYPHPRAITHIIAYPLPGMDQETDVVLELFTPLLQDWEPHTYFKIPVGEPKELQLYVPAPDAVFASTWRFRAYTSPDPKLPPFEVDIKKFMPRNDPLMMDLSAKWDDPKHISEVTAEQLSGVLRVDSYFAPRLLPRTKFIVRVAEGELHLHNSMPLLSSQATSLEGYYVSRPLMRSHRVLSFVTRNTKMHARIGSPAGILSAFNTNLSLDILDCTTGTMEQLVGEFALQAAISGSSWLGKNARVRAAAGNVRVAMHVPKVCTLNTLADDWVDALQPYLKTVSKTAVESQESPLEGRSHSEVADDAERALAGRVSLWIHNTCAAALRVGQEGTDEVVPLGPGATLAYRWRSPSAPKKLRLALANPTANWHWSPSLPFTAGSTSLRLEEPLPATEKRPLNSKGYFVYVKVEQCGSKRCMYLSGRLVLANMLRFNLLYKVRSHSTESEPWRTVISDELTAESLGKSVVCAADCDMVLKIKMMSNESGWSGDIPLKECPKENVPWLVKVPSAGDISYIAVWCRVVRARSDGRVLATIWPLYVLHSHLPLDTDILISSEKSATASESEENFPPLIQSSTGRGSSTHILAPGTSANRHSLAFQYRNIECPVTREAVPLHYGVTDVSVFDKRSPINCIEEVIHEIDVWLKRSSRTSKSSWPYSIVAKHWTEPWRAALLQPRCDVTVRYTAVRAGGGCCLEIQLCPIVLLCNASAIALTLRAHDAAPLCKLEAGTAIAPPSAILKKPFFMSVEMGRETFVSEQLCVTTKEPGRYGALPSGHLALQHATCFSILCNQKVALLTMHYEIHQDINVLGVTSTFVLINRLDTNVLVSPIAIPDDGTNCSLLPKAYKIVAPTNAGSINGTPLCRFWLRGRWRGGDPSELMKFVCLALPNNTNATVPVRLAEAPIRRAIALVDPDGKSIAISVTQLKHEGRWLVIVAHDPCPQFVVHNHTRMALCIGQPMPVAQDHPSTSHVVMSPECLGATWFCTVASSAAIHYSTPAHCARYPLPQNPAPATPATSALPMLSFCRLLDEAIYEWCAPIAVTDGEQLLQFYGGLTVKLRVLNHPHSTLLELRETDHHDMSASDIRRRLHGAVSSRLAISDPSLSSAAVTTDSTWFEERVPSEKHPPRVPKHRWATDAVTRRGVSIESSPTLQGHVPEDSSSTDSIHPLPDAQQEARSATDMDRSIPPQETSTIDLVPPPSSQQIVESTLDSDLSMTSQQEPTSAVDLVLPPSSQQEAKSTLDSDLSIPSEQEPTSEPTSAVDLVLPPSSQQVAKSTVDTVRLLPSTQEVPSRHVSLAVDSVRSPPTRQDATSNLDTVQSTPSAQKVTTTITSGRSLTVSQEVSSMSDLDQPLPSEQEATSIPDSLLQPAGSSIESVPSLQSRESREEDRSILSAMKHQKDPSASESRLRMDPSVDLTPAHRHQKSQHKVRLSRQGVAFTDSVHFRDTDTRLKYKRPERSDLNLSQPALAFHSKPSDLVGPSTLWSESERVRLVIAGVAIEAAASADVPPLFALHLDRTAVLIMASDKKTKLMVSVTDLQIDNLQYESGQYDFAVIASTRAAPLQPDPWPAIWNMFAGKGQFATNHRNASLVLKLNQEKWTVLSQIYKEITELELSIGTLSLYIEDAYVSALLGLSRLATTGGGSAAPLDAALLAEERAIQRPLRLRLLYVHPLDLTLTLHTAVRMYIALDQSPLRLSAFKLHDMMTSTDRLTHALTVHYLSAAILGAGWVVGGLELLGAPGAIASRLGGATGGVKGVVSATAAALLRSLSAWAGSLARNLDILAGDEEHARRAAALRRRPPDSFLAGLLAGITNFAVNILGAVGGLAHHPLVGVAVGETESSAVALRRGLLGALTKPLSATADLVAYAGHGLLRQTGWDPVPEPRSAWSLEEARAPLGWRRDCVRWMFRLAELHALVGFDVMLDNAPLQLLITHKFLVVTDPESERVVEMIDLKSCSLGPYQGQIIELHVVMKQRKASKSEAARGADEDDEYQISAAAMARVARYTGAENGSAQSEERVLSLFPAPGRSLSLHAALAAVLHHNADTHISLL